MSKKDKTTPNTAVRKVNTYITDDGRKVEEHEIVSACVSPSSVSKEEIDTLQKMQRIKVLYLGYLPLGQAEVKFPLPEANNLDEALHQFEQAAEEVLKEIEQQHSKIAVASEQDIHAINQMSQDGPGIIIN